MKRKTKEVTYSLTPKGAMLLAVEMDEDITQRVIDSLELTAIRQECNAVLLAPELKFIHVESSSRA